MKEHTSAPMEHQVPGADYAMCRECDSWAPGHYSPGGLGLCRIGKLRTWTSSDGFTAQMLPYPRQIACDEFVESPAKADNEALECRIYADGGVRLPEKPES